MTTESQTIQPCPFCGSEDDPRLLEFEFGDGIKVYCEHCGAHGPDASTKEDAIKRWNKARRQE